MKLKAFTLIEMLFVMMIISILLLLLIPNLAKKQKVIQDKSCEAMIEVVQGQVVMYELQYQKLPNDLHELVEHHFINEKQLLCPNSKPLKLKDGQVYI